MSERRKPGPKPWKDRDPIRTIRVPDDEWSRWKQLGKTRDMSVAAMIRAAMNSRCKRLGVKK